MRIIFARHGETIENKRDINQGQLGGRLSRKGKEQAKKLAKRLNKENIDIIYCSDLARCRDTLEPFLKLKDVKVVYTKELREKHHGIFQGKHNKVMREWKVKMKEKYPDKRDFRPLKGESFGDLMKRSIKFVDKLIKKEKGKNVLIVSHGGPIACMMLHLFQKHPRTHHKKYHPKNAAIHVVIVKEDGKHRARLINSVKHL